MEKTQYVWYACYGSNLLESRFQCYIVGGQPHGANRVYRGCRDKTLPKKSEPFCLPYELYFAKSSQTWNRGGVAFIKPKRESGKNTLSRRYLISFEQFIDLTEQENNISDPLQLNLEDIKQKSGILLDHKTWYNQLLFLKSDDGIPIFTFTNANFLNEEINPPHQTYLSTIIKGLKSCYSLTDQEIQTYFSTKCGIDHHIPNHHLQQLIANL